MTEWKKAKKTVEFREPEPNAHEWKYVGRTPSGGLAGGDDVYECKLCGSPDYRGGHSCWNDECPEGHKGKTEVIHLGYSYESGDKYATAIVGRHLVVKDGNRIRVVDKKAFLKSVEVIEE